MSANPYVQGWREWDEHYADLVLGQRNWQIAADCSPFISLVLAVGILRLALVERIERYAVASFIRQACLVSSAPQVEQSRS
jgi:type IV secretory pathway TrbF-like protein